MNNNLINFIDKNGLETTSLDWGLFMHWLGGSGNPVELSWDTFDSSGAAQATLLADAWIGTIQRFTVICDSLGIDEDNTFNWNEAFRYSGDFVSSHDWISSWKGYWNIPGGGISAKCENGKKACHIQYTVDMKATDRGDFNRGNFIAIQAYGHTVLRIPDEWFIWVRDHVAGGDFLESGKKSVGQNKTIVRDL